MGCPDAYAQAAWRPGKRRHNVWELVVHCAYWKYAIRRRLLGQARGAFPLDGSNWFHRDLKAGAARWKADVALLGEMHRALGHAVAHFPPHRWGRRVSGGTWTYRDLVAGAAAHDLYHTGSITRDRFA